MTELSIVAPQGLIKPANPKSGKKSQLALFTDSWLELQGYIGAAIDLPITDGDFKEKYGDFSGEQTIKDCIEAMRGVQAVSTEFGDPKSLRAQLIKNPNILTTDEPPTEIYTHTVWLGERVSDTANQLTSGYQSVLNGLTGLPAKEQVENLKAYMLDQTLGPIALSKKMSDEFGYLIKKLGKFEQKINKYNAKLQAFTQASSSIMDSVNQAIGAAAQKIKELKKSRDEAYKALKDFTVAAASSSVGCALMGGLLTPFTGDVSLLVGGAAAIATGVGLGAKATACRAKYNEYCHQIQGEEVEKQKKQRLYSDLGDFNTQIDQEQVGKAISDFLKNLQAMKGGWVAMNDEMLAISNNIHEDNVGSLPFLVKAKANSAIDQWKEIGESAKQFTVDSLVNYTSIAFGDQMPEKILQAA